jgi:hypothetical protein
MTINEIYMANGCYLALFVVLAVLTRASARRIGGALAGGAVISVVTLAIIVVGERLALWRVPITWEPIYLSLFLLVIAISTGMVYLITWRTTRRFGWKGLAVCLAAAATLGPVRDNLWAVLRPHWITFAPGIAPALAVSATYVTMILLGHGVMRLFAGPSNGDCLAARSPQAT